MLGNTLVYMLEYLPLSSPTTSLRPFTSPSQSSLCSLYSSSLHIYNVSKKDNHGYRLWYHRNQYVLPPLVLPNTCNRVDLIKRQNRDQLRGPKWSKQPT